MVREYAAHLSLIIVGFKTNTPTQKKKKREYDLKDEGRKMKTKVEKSDLRTIQQLCMELRFDIKGRFKRNMYIITRL